MLAALLVFLLAARTIAQTPPASSADSNLPPPGTSGNADNVPYIGKSDPKGNPVRLAKTTGHVSNYSEEKIPAYTLPDPLVLTSGEHVTTSEQWYTKRRPEILKFYQTEIYGRIPAGAPKVTWRVTESDAMARDGAAILKRVVGVMGDRPDGPQMNLTVYLPAKADKPVPLLLNLSFGGGARRGAGAPTRRGAAPARGRGIGSGFDPVAEVLSRGWGYATLGYNEIQPDRADRWTEGVIGLTLAEGQSRPAPDQWGTISAWAWGVSRAIDYFETDTAVNAKQVAISGASRLGKTVLWAGAQDDRVAAVFAVVPGEMGASLIRRDWGETLDDMAQNFAWQFAGNLQKWVGKWNDLPVDQHMLIALCAPRPVYVNGGLTDQWSDPKGEFLALVGAGPVYRLLGGKDLGVTDLPPLDKPITDGDLAFHYHSRGHTAVPADWKAFLDFAERHFQAARPAHTAIERRDENSRIAHQQLLAKTKQGRIDVYFQGDSITRRWGATDYPKFLAHWKKSFHGWNAANFAWGGDTTHNILWRMQNGELDRVSPKVIVLQAGTNNLPGRGPADDRKVDDVVGGIRAILAEFQTRVPDSTIIVTAVFPRTQNSELAPAIRKINERIAALADGKRVRFLNMNEQLADSAGRLLPGVSSDGLHLEEPGYEIWAGALRPILEELLGPPAKEDQAPPPTGDPRAGR
jgi:lysophospholipase L1-like esterase